MSDTTRSLERFSNRAEDYARYRPDYPKELAGILVDELHLSPGQVVVDVGCGTGIFSRHLLRQGLKVYGVEPNDNMRRAAEFELSRDFQFQSVKGTAERMPFHPESIDAIFCAQAFHWMDPAAARREWSRILKPTGMALLLWNHFDTCYPLAREYVELTSVLGDAATVHRRTVDPARRRVLFGNVEPSRATLPHTQHLDLTGLIGRTRSLSYCPALDSREYDTLIHGLTDLFNRHSRNGAVTLNYATELVFGKLRT